MNFSDVISVLALVVSLVVAYKEYTFQRKSTKINLDSVFFQEIFMNHLVYEIPKARKQLTFDEKGIPTGTSPLSDEMVKLRKDSLFFKYMNPDFYDDLEKALFNLEDYLLLSEEKEYSLVEQKEYDNEILKRINQIYICIDNQYKDHLS